MVLENLRINTPSKRTHSQALSPSNTIQSPCKKARTGKLVNLRGPMAEKELAADVEATESTRAVCVITNMGGEEVKPTCVVRKDTPPDIIEDLELAWGMERETFSVEDKMNIISLSPEMRESYNAGRWGLVPVDRPIKRRLHAYTLHGKSGEFKNVFEIYKSEGLTSFEYNVVPLYDFDSVITCFPDAKSGKSSPCPGSYASLPSITLPTFPHLAIADFAMKYRCLSKEEEEKAEKWMKETNLRLTTEVEKCLGLCNRWSPVNKFAHEYANLPRLNKFLNPLVHPDDSASLYSVESDNEDERDEPDDFCESSIDLANRVCEWKDAVDKALALAEEAQEPPEPTSYPLLPSSSSPLSPTLAPVPSNDPRLPTK